MSQIEVEAATMLAPIKNSGAMKVIAVVAVGTASGVTDLRNLLGSLAKGHYYTIQPDMPDAAGGRIWFAFGSNSGTIDERATGNGVTACYVKGDLQEFPFVLRGAIEGSSGYASTGATYPFLHHKGSASGYLRIYASSIGSSQNPGSEFLPP